MTILLAFVAVSAIGCNDGYDVRLSFSDEADHIMSRRIEVALVRDCASQELGGAADRPLLFIEFQVDAAAPALGNVDAGSYGLYARAMDQQCRVRAAGCTQVRIDPGNETQLEVILRPSDMLLCVPSDCQDGRCDGDGGVQDGGVEDAGAIDGNVVDVAQDAPNDAPSDVLNDAPSDVPNDIALDAPIDVPLDAFTCSTIINSEPEWELCSEEGGRCGVVFFDSVGCDVLCPALGLRCLASHDDITGMCAPNLADRTSCAGPLNSGHCLCGP